MLSQLPKLFDRNYVIGFFLPVVLGAVIVAWSFQGIAGLQPLRTLGVSEHDVAKLTYLTLILWVAGIGLMMTNNTQYRILEGYLPPLTWIGPLKTWRRNARDALEADYATLREERSRLGDGMPAARLDRLGAVRRKLVTYFPPAAYILPTRFGNVLRAFESYPGEAYGADGVAVWLRLGAVMPKEFTDALDSARAQVNCVLNLLYILGGIGLVSLGVSLRHTPWPQVFAAAGAPHASLTWHPLFVAGVAELAGAYLAYEAAIVLAVGWGALVRAAFDCYLPQLAAQLGYAMPATDAARRAFWKDLSALFVYQLPLKGDRWPAIGK